MSNAFRVLVLGLPLVAAAAALTGCTGGEITKPDGSPVAIPTWGPVTVTFQLYDGGVEDPHAPTYTVNAMQQSGGEVTFSFDPTVPPSATNGGLIPVGNYAVIVSGLCAPHEGSPACDALYVNPHVPVAYNGNTCADYTTGKSVPCAMFHLILCDYYAGDIAKYGSLCTAVTTSGAWTTVGLID
jgi:hypothetical protein